MRARLHVSYSGTVGFCVRYHCRGAHINHGTERCISFGGLRVDAAVSAELLRVLAPLGIEAALRALDARAADSSEVHRQAELALSQARYEAGLARRQYDAVDPDNRLVVAELERRWNDRLVRSPHRGTAYDAEDRESVDADGRGTRPANGAWRRYRGAVASSRRRCRDAQAVLRTAIVEIVAKIVGNTIDLAVHWQGGDHTRLTVAEESDGSAPPDDRRRNGRLIRALARQQPDAGIAAILNRCGKRTGKGNTWTESRVRSHRSAHGIAVYRDGEMAERGELTLEETAQRLTVSKMTVLRLIDGGVIEGRQACKGAPWAIPEARLPISMPARHSFAARNQKTLINSPLCFNDVVRWVL